MQQQQEIIRAADFLREGKLVSFPTETVYGLGANACSDNAVAKIFAAKGRPSFNPLIVHLSSVEKAQHLVQWNAMAEKLATAFWPGPLTLVLPRAENCPVSLLASAGLDTLAIRCPAHELAQALLNECDLPLAAPSANRSGRISPTLAEHVSEELGEHVAMVLDGGACEVGIESSVVSVLSDVPILLRPGSITQEELEKCLGQEVATSHTLKGEEQKLLSPGLLASHYAPDLPLRLNAANVMEGEALLAFGSDVPQGAGKVINLSESGNLQEAAARLFAALRSLDVETFRGIAVMPIPEEGLGVAINDRLRRAAAPKS